MARVTEEYIEREKGINCSWFSFPTKKKQVLLEKEDTLEEIWIVDNGDELHVKAT